MVETGDLENFLNEKSAKLNDIVTILEEGAIVELETQFGKRRMLNIPVELNGRKVLWTPSKVAINAAKEVFKSANTKDWIGKKFQVDFAKMTVKGELKTVVIPKAL